MAQVNDQVRAGRRRDPAVEQRVYEAVLDVFAEAGWAGLTFEAVARRASVGKAALYRRWAGREELLVDVLSALTAPTAPIDTGSTRGDLLELARQTLASYSDQRGLVRLRIFVEARAQPARLAAVTDSIIRSRVRVAREIVRRGVDRGELRPDVPTTLILDLVVGAVINHVISTPTELVPAMMERSESFLTELVDVVLAAVR